MCRSGTKISRALRSCAVSRGSGPPLHRRVPVGPMKGSPRPPTCRRKSVVADMLGNDVDGEGRMLIKRLALLTGIGCALIVSAPAIVRASSLMPVKLMEWTPLAPVNEKYTQDLPSAWAIAAWPAILVGLLNTLRTIGSAPQPSSLPELLDEQPHDRHRLLGSAIYRGRCSRESTSVAR